VDKDSAMTMS